MLQTPGTKTSRRRKTSPPRKISPHPKTGPLRGTRGRCAGRQTLGLIGAGAFGAFCLPYLARHFEVSVCDPRPDLADLALSHGVKAGSLAATASRDIVLLAVPWRALEAVAGTIAPHLTPGALVIECCSIKVKPLDVLRETLPDSVDIVGTHPLFGPQSGRNGVAGLNIAVCAVAGHARAASRVARFLGTRLGLTVKLTSPEDHDRQMAYVQGLTHFLARSISAMDLPALDLTTSTWGHLMRMAETVGDDSDELYRTIAVDNPFAQEVRDRFLASAQTTLAPTALRPRRPAPAAGRRSSAASRQG
jgi:prephenate dehydrogenase